VKIAFAGTPAFAAAALAAIHAAGHEVGPVLCQPDRPSGRGLQLQHSPVKASALELGLPLLQPAGLRLDGRHPIDATAARAALEAAAPDVMVVAAYGLLLPQWILDLPRLGCLNIHASLLPRWRGAAPIQRAIEAGDAATGITIMQMDAGLDTGPVLVSAPLPIAADETSATLHLKLAGLGARVIVTALQGVADGSLRPAPQAPVGVTYAKKVDKREAAIDWLLPASLIERRVRAFDPFPGATLSYGGTTLKLWRAAVRPAIGGHAGEVVSTLPGPLVVDCGEEALELVELQRPGGRRMPAHRCFQTHPPRIGDRLMASAD
jgi:methionyl-tRNA formyltransferase